MYLIKSGLLNTLEAIAAARVTLDALPQNTLIVITKTVHDNANPTYDVYGTLGGLVNGQIQEA